MTETNYLRLCELLSARICHDLVGPVGAVANGIELLGGEGAGSDSEVIALIGTSARTASRRLQAFRVAFGSANALPATGCLVPARELAQGLLEDGKVALEWPPPSPAANAVCDRVAAKIVLNLILLATEALPRGGKVQVGIIDGEAGRLSAAVRGIGPQARVTDEVRAGLAGAFEMESATAKAAPAYLVAWLAREGGAELATSESASGEFEFRLNLQARS